MRKTVNNLLLIYYCIYVLAIIIAGAGYYFFAKEAVFIPERSSAGVAMTSVYIIYLIITIPLSLKLFNTKVKKLAGNENREEKINKYRSYSVWRLVIIGSSLFIGIILFYLLNSRSMIFCAAVAAIALVFCKPSEVRMATELDIDE